MFKGGGYDFFSVSILIIIIKFFGAFRNAVVESSSLIRCFAVSLGNVTNTVHVGSFIFL